MFRLRPVVLVAVALVASVMPHASGAQLPVGYKGVVVRVTFDGNGTYSRDEPGPPSYHSDANVTWHAEYDITLPDLSQAWPRGNVSVPADTATVTGTSTVNEPALGVNCVNQSIVRSRKPIQGTPFIGLYAPTAVSPPNLSTLPTVKLYVEAFGGFDYGLCADGAGLIGVGPFTPAAGAGLGYTFEELLGKFDFDMKEWATQPPHEKTFNVGVNRTASTADGRTATLNWSGTVKLASTAGNEIQGPPKGPDPGVLKAAALARMRADYQKAVWPCLTAATGVGLFFGGLTGPIYGATMLQVALPICVPLIKEIRDLAEVYNDPPDSNFKSVVAVARSPIPKLGLPSCSPLTGGEKTRCGRFQTAVLAYVTAVSRVTDVADALRVTVNRYSGATQAGDSASAARQFAAALQLNKQLTSTAATRAKSGAALRAQLRAAGVNGRVTPDQYSAGATEVLRRLADAGLPDSEARAALAPALVPLEQDLLAAIAQP